MSTPDIEVLTKTTLQEDWTTHSDISVSTPGAGLAINLDGSGRLIVSYIDGATVKSAHRNLDVDGNSLRTWNIEDTYFPSSTHPVFLDSILAPSKATFLAAIGQDNKVYILDCSSRFPKWEACTTHLQVKPTRLSLFATTIDELRITVFDSSSSNVYVVNPLTGKWFQDQAILSVCTNVSDFKVGTAFAKVSDKDHSLWGYVVSGGVWGNHMSPGVITVSGDQNMATSRPISAGTYTSVTYTSIEKQQHRTTPLIFGIDDSGVATYFQADGNAEGTFTPRFPFTTSTKMKQLDAVYRTGLDPNQNIVEWIDLFAIDVSGNLWHNRSAAISDLGRVAAAKRLDNGDFAVTDWETPAIISMKPLSTFDLTIDPSGSGQAYLVSCDSSSPTSSLSAYLQDMASTAWSTTPIATINHKADVVKRKAYYVEMTVLKDGVKAPGLLVKINAPDYCQIDANGISTSVDSVRAYSSTTNAYGNVCLTLPANEENLGCSALTVWAEGMDVNARIDVQPTSEVLSTMASSNLRDAKDQTDGSPVFQGLTDTQMSDLETAVKNVKQAFNSDPPKSGNSNAGRRYIHRTTRPALARSRLRTERHLGFISCASPGSAFEITLRPNFAFKILQSHEAGIVADEDESIFHSWGDFWRSVANGVITVTKVVVTPLVDAVTTTVKCVVNGAHKVWNGITQFVNHAFDVIGEMFSAVKSVAQKVFNWLAFLFSWDDIKATAIGLRNAFDSAMDSSKSFITKELQPKLDGFFSQAKIWLNDNLDGALSDADQYKIGDSDKPNPDDPTANMPSSSSWLSNKVLNSAQPTSFNQAPSVNDATTSTFQTFINNMTAIGFSDDLTAALKDASDFFSTLASKGAIDALTFKAFVKIFKDIVFLFIDLADAALETFLTVMVQAADAFKAILEAPIDIPVVSAIFKNLVGLDLTLFNLVAVPLAIPATIIFKIINGTAPFSEKSQIAGSEKLAAKKTDDTLIWSFIFAVTYGLADTALDVESAKPKSTFSPAAGNILGGIATVTSFLQIGLGVWSMPSGPGTQAYQRQQYTISVAGIGAFISTVAYSYGFANKEKIFFQVSNGFIQFVSMILPVGYGIATLGTGVWHLVNMKNGDETTSGKDVCVVVGELASIIPSIGKVVKFAQDPEVYLPPVLICDAVGHGVAAISFIGAIIADHN